MTLGFLGEHKSALVVILLDKSHDLRDCFESRPAGIDHTRNDQARRANSNSHQCENRDGEAGIP